MEPLWKLLGVTQGLTAVIGSGGKTSLLYELAEELRPCGTVLLATTTHIMKPPQYPFAETAEQLAAYGWTWQGDLAEQPAMATMSLTQGSGAEPGQITFTWWYTKDYGDPQEIYEGSWSLTDSGEYIDLTMTRSGGRQYTKGEAPTTVSGMFPVQVPAAFDVFPVLNVTGGGGAYGFPIQQIPNELLMFEPAQG